MRALSSTNVSFLLLNQPTEGRLSRPYLLIAILGGPSDRQRRVSKPRTIEQVKGLVIERSWSLPCKGKAFLYRTRDAGVQAIDDKTLSEEILTQEEQEPFWSVEEL